MARMGDDGDLDEGGGSANGEAKNDQEYMFGCKVTRTCRWGGFAIITP